MSRIAADWASRHTDLARLTGRASARKSLRAGDFSIRSDTLHQLATLGLGAQRRLTLRSVPHTLDTLRIHFTGKSYRLTRTSGAHFDGPIRAARLASSVLGDISHQLSRSPVYDGFVQGAACTSLRKGRISKLTRQARLQSEARRMPDVASVENALRCNTPLGIGVNHQRFLCQRQDNAGRGIPASAAGPSKQNDALARRVNLKCSPAEHHPVPPTKLQDDARSIWTDDEKLFQPTTTRIKARSGPKMFYYSSARLLARRITLLYFQRQFEPVSPAPRQASCI